MVPWHRQKYNSLNNKKAYFSFNGPICKKNLTFEFNSQPVKYKRFVFPNSSNNRMAVGPSYNPNASTFDRLGMKLESKFVLQISPLTSNQLIGKIQKAFHVFTLPVTTQMYFTCLFIFH